MPAPIPVSTGLSWYEDELGARPTYPALDGSLSTDVAIVGGGYTGLSAAAHLAQAGVGVVLLEARRMGDGASGRNGGQLGTGHRAWAEDLEAELGLTRAKALFELAEEAKTHLLGFADQHGFEIGYRPGQLSVVHKKRLVEDYRRHVELMGERFSYPHLAFMDREETARRLGSQAFFAGVRDTGTGHVQPLKLVDGTARVAAASGARLFEQTRVTGIEAKAGKVILTTARGTVTAAKALLAVNAYGADLEPVSAAHVMPIGSFIGATAPLSEGSQVIPGGESVDDSRFVVRYFRKTADNRLLFGGREIYTTASPSDIRASIGRQIAEVYPHLDNVEITHAWGGYVGITMPRKPFVREVMPNVLSAGGYSGHGVMLANYVGRLYADAITGHREKLRLLEDLKIPPFPGGRRLRAPLMFLALSWYALRDRI